MAATGSVLSGETSATQTWLGGTNQIAQWLEGGRERLAVYGAPRQTALDQWAAPRVKPSALSAYATKPSTSALAAWSKQRPRPQKSDVEEIADAIIEPGTTNQKTRRVVAVSSAKHPEETKEALLQKTLNLIWTNSRPLICIIAAATLVAISVALFQVYFAAGSWALFLTILRNLGFKFVPAVLVSALRRGGIAIATGASINQVLMLAERNETARKILARRVDPKFVTDNLKRIGVDLNTYDLSVKNMTRIAINNGVALATGDMSTFLVSTGISATISGAGVAAGKAKEGLKTTVAALDGISTHVIDAVLSEDATESTDAIELSREVADRLDATPVARRYATKNVPPQYKTQTSSDIATMIAENKAIIAAGTTAVALASIALTADLSAMSEVVSSLTQNVQLPQAALAAADFVKESSAARSALFGVISNQIGLQRVIDLFIDRLTPDQITKLKDLETRISRSKITQRNTYLTEFYSILIGDRIYESSALDRMSIQRLKEVARSKNIRFDERVSKSALIDAITKDQAYRLKNITQIVAGTLLSTAKTAITAAALETAYQNFPLATASKKEIVEQLQQVSKEALATPTTDPQVEAVIREEVSIQQERVITEEEWQEQMRRAQDALATERAAARAARRAAAAKTDSARQAAAAQKVQAEKEVRARQAEINQAKVITRLAARRLQQAAMMEDLTKQMGVVIVNQDGVARPIPIDDVLLDPRMQKAMEGIEFTPLMQHLSLQVAKSSTSWIPGLGYVEATLNTVNWSLDVAEKMKDVYKIANVAVQITSETGESKIDIGEKNIETLDWLLKKRVPTLSQAIDDLVTLERVNLKVTVLEVLRDKILYGWDNQRVAYEIGKRVVVGKEGGKIAESTIQQIGEMIWKAVG